MVAKATQRKLTGALVWLIICLVIILALMLSVGSLYTDLKIAQGANKQIEKRIDRIKENYSIYCRKED